MNPLYPISFFFLFSIGIYTYFFWETMKESPVQWAVTGSVLVIGVVFIEIIRRSHQQQIEVPDSIKAITKEDGSRPYQTFEQVVRAPITARVARFVIGSLGKRSKNIVLVERRRDQ
mgnify:CR=1 FL=1